MVTQAGQTDSDLEVLLEIGESLLSDGDAAGALQAFTEVLARAPRNADALVGKGRALMTLDRDAQAVRFLELATTARPDQPTPWMLLGTAALADGNGDVAARAFARAQHLGLAPSESYLNLARAAYYSLDQQKAHDYAQLALTEDPGNDGARAWSEALDAIPDRAAFLLDVGRAHCRRGRFEKGLTLFLESLALEPSPVAHALAGRALLALQRPSEAEEHLTAALALKPDDVEALTDLASAQALAGRNAEAGQTLEHLLAIEPENTDGLTTRARLLLRAKDAASTAAVVGKLVALAPERADTWLLEAWRLKAAARGKRARLAVERAVSLDTQYAPPWLEAAALLAELGDAAIADLCRGKYLNLIGERDVTRSGEPASTLRDIDVESRELDELELQPEELARAFDNRAVFYAALGELSRARRYYDRLADELPQHETSDMACRRGILLLQLNDIPSARTALQRALQLDPGNPAALAMQDRIANMR